MGQAGAAPSAQPLLYAVPAVGDAAGAHNHWVDIGVAAHWAGERGQGRGGEPAGSGSSRCERAAAADGLVDDGVTDPRACNVFRTSSNL